MVGSFSKVLSRRLLFLQYSAPASGCFTQPAAPRPSSILYRRSVHSRTTSFFFPSRRRHTTCLSDWSSDVCSSDLIFNALAAGATGYLLKQTPPAELLT